MEGVPAVGALPSASWVFGSLRGVVLGWPGGPVPFLKIAFPKKTKKKRLVGQGSLDATGGEGGGFLSGFQAS